MHENWLDPRAGWFPVGIVAEMAVRPHPTNFASRPKSFLVKGEVRFEFKWYLLGKSISWSSFDSICIIMELREPFMTSGCEWISKVNLEVYSLHWAHKNSKLIPCFTFITCLYSLNDMMISPFQRSLVYVEEGGKRMAHMTSITCRRYLYDPHEPFEWSFQQCLKELVSVEEGDFLGFVCLVHDLTNSVSKNFGMLRRAENRMTGRT